MLSVRLLLGLQLSEVAAEVLEVKRLVHLVVEVEVAEEAEFVLSVFT